MIRCVILFLVFLSMPVMATIIDVPDDYPNIQEGIDAAADGDTVLVQPGTYVENINFNGHNIVLGSLFLTTQDTTYIAETIIDAGYVGSVITFDNGENGGSVITGFTVEHGESTYGGGIYCYNANPLIIRNHIRANSSSGRGGGIYCENSSAIIMRNAINGNSAGEFGGGIYCENLGPIINGNMIYDNSVYGGRGGGIYCRTADATIRKNLISVNSVSVKGGGIYCWRSNGRIENNVLFSNSASRGGGIYCWISSPEIANCVVYGNSAVDLGGGICLYDTSNATIKNSIFWNNSASVTSEIFSDDYSFPEISFCDVSGGMDGQGNIDVIPAFRDLNSLDFHLMSTACGDPYDSPCIDAGHPNILDSLLDCSWGLGGSRSDMGAYGGGDSVTVGIEAQEPTMPGRFILFQHYPNPFNAVTVIRYALPEPADVKIEIYDILGRNIETLIEREQPAGYHRISWDASENSSGMYFYKILAGKYVAAGKMLLLK